jgi:hypothetical protein
MISKAESFATEQRIFSNVVYQFTGEPGIVGKCAIDIGHRHDNKHPLQTCLDLEAPLGGMLLETVMHTLALARLQVKPFRVSSAMTRCWTGSVIDQPESARKVDLGASIHCQQNGRRQPR